MRKLPLVLALASLLLGSAHAADKKDKATPEDAKPESAWLHPQASESEGSVSVEGKRIAYKAVAGTLVLHGKDDKENEPTVSMFYVAYFKKGDDASKRPITFIYNGGPGSASVWLHMGAFGPRRVITKDDTHTPAAPYQLINNNYSLLDASDLVFIDAPGTGYSHPVGKGTIKDVAGVDEDLGAFTKFIIRYITVNHRWNSPKFLFGESYGTTRSAGLSATLNEAGVQLNGIVLLSSILNYNARSAGLDNEYITDLPSFAAIAYYHNKVANKPADILTFIQQAREFARGPYAEALYAGNALSDEDKDKIAAQLSSFTGLSTTFIKDANLRITPTRFRKELLRDQNKILGRYDARFEAPDADAAGENPGYDPSDTGISGAYVASFHDYLEKDLKFVSQDAYNNSGPDLNQGWDWKHHPASGGPMARQQAMPYVAGDLGDTMRKNPHLKVFAANGIFDLATPFTSTEWELAHMGTDAKLRGNVTWGYYPAGHMVYLNVEALKAFRQDLARFYDSAK